MVVATKPKAIEVKVYNVGLGDSILVSFHTSAAKNNVFRMLFDFGSIGRNPDSPPMMKIAEQIVEDCRREDGKSQLDVLIATHRHLDHLSGFGGKTGQFLEDNMLPPKRIIQPWTEEPEADLPGGSSDPNSGSAFMRQSMVEAQEITESIMQEVVRRRSIGFDRSTDDEVWFYGSKNLLAVSGEIDLAEAATRDLADEVASFHGFSSDAVNTEQITNRDALERISRWKAAGSKVEYVSSGFKSKATGLIPGLQMQILGPAGPDHWDALKKEGRQDELWARLAGFADENADDNGKMIAFDQKYGPYGVPPIFPQAAMERRSHGNKDNVRWLVEKLDRLRGSQLLGFVRELDSHINNTSVVLLLKFGNFTMLFPGDAEVGAWHWINQKGTGPTSSFGLPLETILEDVDLYKVGHHGSNNATPILSMWNFLAKDRTAKRPLHCVMSTQWSRFENKIPNQTLWQTLNGDKQFQTMATSGPPSLTSDLPIALNKKWRPQKDGKNTIAYSRMFEVAK